ncbi:hypothetical protein BED47_02705 [Gottfriedia luciferensis]|uniref:Pyrroline-5-carboxylate reductase catalytic N-terminal domain-containing protein n=1 Tax=Gottfriedia luciferensis TaxID=178774 RepID=A0ABX2ZV13_9BACI|nr:NAD(P)-binding domain-containing protein [Gottfriedia luciferensis]ODG93214.1 hypothetical protein BED47_02705 [Gottfriedia luciferensis]
MKIGIIGNGQIGNVIANRLVTYNHEITFGVRNLESNQKVNPIFNYVETKDIAINNELIILAVPGNAVDSAVKNIIEIDGKIVIDLTNPIGEGLKLTRGTTTSNAEEIQKIIPKAKVVKTLNTVGLEKMIDPTVNEEKITMLIAGDHDDANLKVSNLIAEIGFDPLIVGKLYFSRYLEPFAMIRIEMVRVQGMNPNTGIKWMR